MDDQSLRNVLAIMRQLAAFDPNQSPIQFIYQLAGQDVSPANLHRIAGYLCSQFEQARVVIAASSLVEEAKGGVFGALNALDNTFSIVGLPSNLHTVAAQLPSYIGNFVILLSAMGLATSQSTPEEAVDLASEIEKFAAAFDDPAVDPAVRDVAKKHLVVLATLLRHVPVFGLEAALTSYFDLVSRLRRADSKTTDASKGALDKLMGTVRQWGERIKSIDEIVNSGASLLERAEKAAPLLEYIPNLG